MIRDQESSITITAYKPGKKKPEHLILLRSIYEDDLEMEAQRVRLKMKKQGFRVEGDE